MAEPFVSIVIPVYNAEKYLSACINSLKAQDVEALEIIFVNDGSTDASGYLCHQFAQTENRVTVIDTPNRGAGAARNQGIDRARGKYVYMVDADDELDPNLVTTCVQVLREHPADLLHFGYSKVNLDGKTMGQVIPPELQLDDVQRQKSELVKMIGAGTSLAMWTKWFSRDFLNRNRLRFGSHRRTQDIQFFLKCIQFIQTAKSISVPLYRFRVIFSGAKYDPAIVESHIELYSLLRDVFDDMAQSEIARYRATMFALWFGMVVPMNVARAPSMTTREKVELLREMLSRQDLWNWFEEIRDIAVPRRFHWIKRVFRQRNPAMLYALGHAFSAARRTRNLVG